MTETLGTLELMEMGEMDHKELVLRLLVWFVSMATNIAAATITAETVNCTRKPDSDH